MAEVIASTLLEAVFRKLADEAVKQVVRAKGIRSELKNLGKTLSDIQDLLSDASDKEVKEVRVQKWLNGLQHLTYDIDDILDDLATEAIRSELTEQSGGSTRIVRKLIPSCCTNFSLSSRMRHRLDDINNKLQDLEKEKVTLGLTMKSGRLEVKDDRSKDKNRQYQTSLVDASSIVGRQGDKDALVLKLLGNEPGNENFSIVPIVGLGGVGKTTLAKMLYEDEQVNAHFEFKAWVCVSDEWDTFSMSNIIFQSVTGEAKEFKDLNLLQVDLRDRLRNKSFLLVLDDVWSESSDDWESLVAPLKACAPGSKIIVTTRKEKLLTELGCGKLNHLKKLSHDDAVCLFAHHAFGANNFDSHPRLKAPGEGIVRKCDGLPLALIALGRLLRRKNEDEIKWKEIEDSEIWSLEEEDASQNDTTENDVLDALKPYNECLKRLGVVNYPGMEFPKWVGDPSFRHLARVSIRGCKKCTSLPPLGQLQSLKELSIHDMGDVTVVGSEFSGTGFAFPSLEVLSFEGMQGWEVWSTNGTSTTGVIKDAVFPCLKELHIIDCPNLVEISLKALLSLRDLSIRECGDGVLRSLVHAAPSVTKMEIWNISGLTNEVWRGVTLDLKAVEELEINGCDEIRYLWESKESEASSKVLVNLSKLSLGEKDEEEYNYGSNLLTSLRSLLLLDCENFKHLSCPNNIETLGFYNCNSITSVSFFSRGGGQKLRSVTICDCEKLLLLKEELGEGGEKNRLLINSKSMPMLESLWIEDHPNVASIFEFGGNFIHLTTLIIRDCESTGESLFPDLQLQSLTSLTALIIKDCPSMDVATGLWPPNLRKLTIGGLKKPISEWGPQKFPTSLVNLTLDGETEEATNWSQLSHLHLPSSLTRLWIRSFDNMETVSEGLQHLTSLQHLWISGCPKIKDLPETLLPSLLSLEIWGCPNLKELPVTLLHSLLRLEISNCPDLAERCSRGGSYWPQISHIPCIKINGKSQT
ncbi:NB-ARC domains-containing protein [Artemisia annua]|uniref:NB-ARC domains-containing protein n=1 Tax=Artemisia annua TaxID=35608 RepID=A0A2U1NA70_ARTAN|nr:NB-ARC domains-containing protein [Artemisia annua]